MIKVELFVAWSRKEGERRLTEPKPKTTKSEARRCPRLVEDLPGLFLLLMSVEEVVGGAAAITEGVMEARTAHLDSDLA